MTDSDELMMELAIAQAENCIPKNPHLEPKVGAVIAIDGQVIASAHRGPDDHAEMRALVKAGAGVDLSKATVYTTLEPCTREVRRGDWQSCTERLIAAHVHKVVIGILDPNQGVCGRGVLRLQEHQIEVALFPEVKAKRIRRMNEDFIRTQKGLGVKITEPDPDKTTVVIGNYSQVILKGVLINLPGPDDEIYAVVQQEQKWWPQAQIVIDQQTLTWRTTVTLGGEGEYIVHLIRVSMLGRSLIRFFYKIGDLHKAVRKLVQKKTSFSLSDQDLPDYPSIEQLILPKGWDAEHRAEFLVKRPASPASSKKEESHQSGDASS